MTEIKITEMPELTPFDSYTFQGGTAPEDFLPIIDVSESSNALKNKKVRIATLFEKYLTAEDVRTEINNSNQTASVERTTLTDNTYQVTTVSKYYFLNPDGVNRNVQIVVFDTGGNIYIKNTSSTNTISLGNMVTNNGLTVLNYTIPASKTVHIVYDGVDHHVIPLDTVETQVTPPPD